MKDLNCFVFAGEQSGDLLGCCLLKELRQNYPRICFTGVGGPQMRAVGMSSLLQMEDFQVMGFTDVLRALPRLWGYAQRIINYIIEAQPDMCILIDYPGWNLRLAKMLRKRGFKNRIVQYVSPSVWAHGKKRINTMVKTLDLLLCIFPFEPGCFLGHPLKVHYMGHPLIDIVDSYSYDDNWFYSYGLTSTKNVIGIFPGSRTKEIVNNFPKQLKAAEKMFEKDPSIRFAISIARIDLQPLVMRILRNSSLKIGQQLFFISTRHSYELMRDCHTAIAKAGTVTLELALHRRPTVVVYEVSKINRFYARYILNLQLEHFCLVNILSNKRVFPELIEMGFTSDNLYHHLQQLHQEGLMRQQCIADCHRIKQLLKNAEGIAACKSAAQAIDTLWTIPQNSGY